MLRGGHPNSLGRTAEAVDLVLGDQARLPDLFAAMTDPDEVVRLRVGDALEKVCREQPGWFVIHVDHLLRDLGQVEQPSVQWHVAQMLHRLRSDLTERQARQATTLLQQNLSTSRDWIVLNVTMDVLAAWATADATLAGWLVSERLRQPPPSVARRATQRLAGWCTETDRGGHRRQNTTRLGCQRGPSPQRRQARSRRRAGSPARVNHSRDPRGHGAGDLAAPRCRAEGGQREQAR